MSSPAVAACSESRIQKVVVAKEIASTTVTAVTAEIVLLEVLNMVTLASSGIKRRFIGTFMQ